MFGKRGSFGSGEGKAAQTAPGEFLSVGTTTVWASRYSASAAARSQVDHADTRAANGNIAHTYAGLALKAGRTRVVT